MRTLKLTIEYDGTDFVGWQSQAEGRTVQDEITKVLEQVLQRPTTLNGAGRTDSGVHARGQVASFRTESVLGTGSLLSALNGLLPDDIVIRSVEEVPSEFHARYSASERLYRYTISLVPAALGRRYHWFVKYDLHLDSMHQVAALVTGTHDFEAFSRFDPEAQHYLCTIVSSAWTTSPDRLHYEICGNRFVHGMVRALVGTMVDVGRGYSSVDGFAEILASRDRRRAGMAAPAQGLVLEEVRY
jgi:tRNA pseudouridine38-40 synthase